MKKILAALASFSTAFLLISATTAPAFAAAPMYKLVPATAVTKAKSVVVGETLWRCAPAGCVAGESGSRPAIVCAQAARKVGKIESFTANGAAFTADELAKCNEKARG
jgi:hypothetical protein